MNGSKRVKKVALIYFLLLAYVSTSFGAEFEHDSCGLVYVGMFNGVWNTEADAIASMAVLDKLIAERNYDVNTRTILFYNQTAGVLDLRDIFETFELKAEEVEEGLSKRTELFWSAILNDDDGFWRNLKNIIIGIPQRILLGMDTLYSTITSKVLDLVGLAIDRSQSLEVDTGKHREHLNFIFLDSQLQEIDPSVALLKVAHSEGSLISNKARDHALNFLRVPSDNIESIYVGPAATNLHGPYVLSTSDVVINSLNLLGKINAKVPNITLAPTFKDFTGHTFVGTYLRQPRSKEAITGHIDTAMRNFSETVGGGTTRKIQGLNVNATKAVVETSHLCTSDTLKVEVKDVFTPYTNPCQTSVGSQESVRTFEIKGNQGDYNAPKSHEFDLTLDPSGTTSRTVTAEILSKQEKLVDDVTITISLTGGTGPPESCVTTPPESCPCFDAFEQHVLPGLPGDGHRSFDSSFPDTRWCKIYSGDLAGEFGGFGGPLAVFREDTFGCYVYGSGNLDIGNPYPVNGTNQACTQLCVSYGAGLPLHPQVCDGGGFEDLFHCDVNR